MDFRTKVDNQVYGVRVSALMIRDGQIYLVKSPKEGYYLLGGAILVNETTEEAIKREIKEEVGISIEVEKLAFIVENHFTLEETSYHQVEFHYLVQPLGEPRTEIIEGGEARSCEWVPLDQLGSLDLNPSFLKKALHQLDTPLTHVTNKGV
ncbi:NUDIX hydrolase [Streptococcus saliviloxodontae]|uniref:ADP-ribose pyrophosphatase YjhB (NUDIX family) n=1 Tax=Streptococcus saliviloxodontae TaxID=1349416 RepID=A0ABS2PK65_9STRE|nr:NUDIX domain-containing protein [Streptococcus saliviloxodontae]MBM7635824.1 ADP-ribose pyrophosphatase YjhB (NUDIX family) [Streptococcus saliviloxodontae]